MTTRVRILDDIVVNQIAAGEVVERPASVVKELVENSIDAQATEITVIIDNGGRSKIEVIDNGQGMQRDDALLAIERFGTSKITNTEDLTSISTLGFRGEALPSIAAVSRFTLATAPQTGESNGTGVEIVIHGGRVRDVREQAMPCGTRIAVKQLFYNVPARRKFLRSERTEAGQVRSLLLDFAATCPDIRFRLVTDGNETLLFHPGGGFLERAKSLKLVSGRGVSIDQTLPSAIGEMRVQAYLSHPAGVVRGAAKLRLIVNGRSVRDRLLLSAIREGYATMVKPGMYPSGVFKLDLAADQVDVNVHPQKLEIRFRDSSRIFAVVASIVRRALGDVTPLAGRVERETIPEIPANTPPYDRAQATAEFVVAEPLGAYPASSEGAALETTAPQQSAVLSEVPERFAFSEKPLSSLQFLGQIFHCYLLLADGEKFVIVDMHAAHERVSFYRIKMQLRDNAVSTQALLIPEVIDLPAERVEQFEEFQTILARLGIEAELFGDAQVVVRSLPSALARSSAQAIFNDLLSFPDWADWSAELDERWDHVISRLACHGSIRSGRDLERAEVYELLESLEEVEQSAFCPHGRPVVRELSRKDLEEMFGRI